MLWEGLWSLKTRNQILIDGVIATSFSRTTYNSEILRVCGDSYQCHFDYVVTLKRDFAAMTKYYQDEFVNIKEGGLTYGKNLYLFSGIYIMILIDTRN